MTPVSHTIDPTRKTGGCVTQIVEDARTIARAFVEARRAGAALPDFPGTMPATLDEAYAVQDAALALADGRVAGWKVGKIAPPVDGANRLAGPIFADQVFDGADVPAMPVFADGFAAAEAEFLLRLAAAPDPAKTDYTHDEALALVDAVHVGIEVASSPFPGINQHGPAVTVADFGNNNGLVVGVAADGWRDADLDRWPVTLTINDVEIGRATTATMLDGPFGAVRFLLEHAARRGIALQAGQWVSTGAVTGVHPVKPGDRVVAGFDSRWTVECTIEAR
jgi:2-keto-4-pentenoate hydratase